MLIARMRGLNELALRSMIVAYEHHINIDRSGYPSLEGHTELSLFGRIVAIADCFDAMTAHRAYRKAPFSPYAALHQILTKNREKFDPLLLKAFINTVGMYPAGTAVLLDTNELAVVVHHNTHDIFRPKVQVVTDKDRKPVVDGRIIDLSLRDEETGAYTVTIVSALDPDEYGINVADVLA
jgi:HD-GYP domain-containing protein (c-di-GMP phosphodiesterase class II)